jgi:EAL domain-containing protein (putative c-di-GMP-specific phosphodiesterase class I)
MNAKIRTKRKNSKKYVSLLPCFRKPGQKNAIGFGNNQSVPLCFQPIFSIRKGTIYGYELEIAFKNNPTGKMCASSLNNKRINTPIPLKYLFTEEITHWIMNCKDVSLFFKVSMQTFISHSPLTDLLKKLSQRWKIPKKQMVFEISGKTLIPDYDIFKQIAAYYQEDGYRLAIDNFDTGYNCLKLLSIIEPDFIKIGAHCLSKADKSSANANLFNRVITACRKAGIEVIAAQIEEEEELERILGMDIELLQGRHPLLTQI